MTGHGSGPVMVPPQALAGPRGLRAAPGPGKVLLKAFGHPAAPREAVPSSRTLSPWSRSAVPSGRAACPPRPSWIAAPGASSLPVRQRSRPDRERVAAGDPAAAGATAAAMAPLAGDSRSRAPALPSPCWRSCGCPVHRSRGQRMASRSGRAGSALWDGRARTFG